MKIFGSLLTLATLPLSGFALFVPLVWYGPNSELQLSTGKQLLREQHAELPIDHNKPELGTFRNRYWVNGDHYGELGGPVFVYDAGAGTGNDAVPLLLEQGLQSAVMQLARAFHGAGVVLEHRYYGQSIPFVQKVINGTLNATLTDLKPDQWKYHTLDQAVADINYFPQVFEMTNSSAAGNVAGEKGLKPQNTPYVILGGGIGGVRAAAARLIKNSAIFASWASSAPIQAQVEYPQFFENIGKALPSDACREDIRDVRFFIDGNLNGTFQDPDFNPLTIKDFIEEAMNGVFNSSSSEADRTSAAVKSLGVSNLATMRDFSEVFNGFQIDGIAGATQICKDISTQNGFVERFNTSALATFEPVSYVADTYLQTLNRYQTSAFTLLSKDQQKIRQNLGKRAEIKIGGGPEGEEVATVEIDHADTLFDSDSSRPQKKMDRLSWQYAYCTQFGLFIAANPKNNQTIQSHFVSRDAVQAECNVAFAALNVTIPEAPQVNDITERYGGRDMRPFNTFFTSGSHDPWLSATIAAQDVETGKRNANKNPPAHDQLHPGDDYFGLIIQNATHAQDMVIYSDSSPLVRSGFNETLQTFAAALQLWLESFDPVIKAAETAANANAKNSAGGLQASSLAIAGFICMTTFFLTIDSIV